MSREGYISDMDMDAADRRNAAAVMEAERAEILLAAAKRETAIDPARLTLAAAALTGAVARDGEHPFDTYEALAEYVIRAADATLAALHAQKGEGK